jgi:hypothetical protein
MVNTAAFVGFSATLNFRGDKKLAMKNQGEPDTCRDS